MAEKVLMIALSPTMETGTIVKWHKQEGDEVISGDVLCEVETDKATMEYESVNEGILLKIILAEGREAQVEEPIAVIGEKGEDISGLLKEIEEREKGAPKAEAEGKAPRGLEEERSLKKTEAPESQEREKVAAPASKLSEMQDRGALKGHKASPLARQMAQQHNIELSSVEGTGPDGRVIKRDIESMLSRQTAPAGRFVQKKAAKTEEIKVSGKRKVIAQRLSESKFSAPHYYLRTIVAVDSLFAARKALNRKSENRVSFNAFVMKIAAEALRRYPMVNASWRGETIVQFGSADIGLAVAQPDGLITPIVKDCWNKGIIQIDGELKELIEKAMNGTLKPEEYNGATFTITNLGSFGIHEFTAIINPPGSAILAVGQARREPVVDENDEIVIQTNMALTLSSDHRVIDGAVGAQFMRDLKEMMENPIAALY
jgi:pyruvate dehydrogenase E2 component (dihydrolipoamide acetyltransferase)